MTHRGATIADLQKFPLKLTKYWYQFASARTASRLHREYHFDGIWAMMAHSACMPAGIFKTFHPKVKYLLTLQEGDPPEYIERIALPVWPLFKHGFTSADFLQTISTFLLAWGRRMGFAGESEVIPNAVNAAHFSKPVSLEERQTVREEIGLEPNDSALVTTSRLVYKNAVDDVICALVHLPEQIGRAHV